MSPKKPTVAQLQEQVAQLTEDLRRAQADAFNIRRRADEDRAQIGAFAKTEIITALLPVLDNLDRAIAHAPTDISQSEFGKGLIGVQKQLGASLGELGISRIETVGKAFDPHSMEAVAVEGEGENELVSEELQSGYQMNGNVIRHAMVKITKQ